MAASARHAAGTAVGYREFVDTADHFRVRVPAGWFEIYLASPSAKAALEQEVRANPRLEGLLGASVAGRLERG
jgi:hypothetical protein